MPSRLVMWVLGLALVAVGIAAGSFALDNAPDSGGNYTVLKPPAVARYDPETDKTLLVETCYHCGNQTGFLVDGDHSSLNSRVHLRAVNASAWTLVPVDPVTVEPTDLVVTEAHRGPFEIVSPAPRLAALAAAPTFVILGIAMLARPPQTAIRYGAVALVSALAVVVPPIDGEVGMIVFVLGFPLTAIATIGVAERRQTRHLWPVPLIMWASALWTLIQSASYFPVASAV